MAGPGSLFTALCRRGGGSASSDQVVGAGVDSALVCYKPRRSGEYRGRAGPGGKQRSLSTTQVISGGGSSVLITTARSRATVETFPGRQLNVHITPVVRVRGLCPQRNAVVEGDPPVPAEFVGAGVSSALVCLSGVSCRPLLVAGRGPSPRRMSLVEGGPPS